MLAGLVLAAVLASPLDGFQAEAQRQCPQRPVGSLDAADLRARLQAFEAALPPPLRAEIDETRNADCSAAHNAYAAACENAADVEVLTRQGRLQEAVAFICGTVL